MRSRAKSRAVFSRRRWRHLREHYRIKIASKNRNCGDAKFSFICCRKKQRTNAKSERSKGRGLAICRHRQIYATIGVELRPYGEIGPILRTDFCGQGCCSSIDDMNNYDCISDINECALGMAGCAKNHTVTCEDSPGGSWCECRDNYVGDGRRCDSKWS